MWVMLPVYLSRGKRREREVREAEGGEELLTFQSLRKEIGW